MPTQSGKKNTKISSKAPKSNPAKDYSNDPYFVKKIEASKAMMKKHRLPKEILNDLKK